MMMVGVGLMPACCASFLLSSFLKTTHTFSFLFAFSKEPADALSVSLSRVIPLFFYS